MLPIAHVQFRCAFQGCGSIKYNKLLPTLEKVTFFKFPKDGRKDAWADVCQIPRREDYKNLYLCEHHFSSSCIRTSGKYFITLI